MPEMMIVSVLIIQLCYSCCSSEVTTPLSMKEVGGYIEKQVAYLSGESSQHLLGDVIGARVFFDCVLNLFPSRRPR